MRYARLIALLAGVQLALWLGWRALRAPDVGLRPLDQPLPALTVYGPGDQPAALPAGPFILHVWATWCPPCRDELPGLLAFAAEAPLPVLAVATDPDWPTIARFAGASPALRRADGRALGPALAVDALPVTFVVGDGRLRARVDGARDWADPATRRAVIDAAR